MSDFWDLFAETGDIGFYLLYLESNENIEPKLGNGENAIICSQEAV